MHKKVRIYSPQAVSMLSEGASAESVATALGEKAYELISLEDAKAQGVSFTEDNIVRVDDSGNIVDAADDGGDEAAAEAAGEEAAGEEAAGEEAAGEEAAEEQDPAAANAGALASAEASSNLDAMLTRLGALAEENATLKAEAKVLKDGAAKAQSNAEAMRTIVVSKIQTMQVGLSTTPISTETNMSVDGLLAMHQEVSEKFNATFRSGQRSSSAETQANGKPEVSGGMKEAGQKAARLESIGGGRRN